jgi:hypothetical protein
MFGSDRGVVIPSRAGRGVASRTSPQEDVVSKRPLFISLVVLALGASQPIVTGTPVAADGEKKSFFREPQAVTWEPGVYYKDGEIVRYGSALYRCVRTHTSRTGETPALVCAFWVRA